MGDSGSPAVGLVGGGASGGRKGGGGVICPAGLGGALGLRGKPQLSWHPVMTWYGGSRVARKAGQP